MDGLRMRRNFMQEDIQEILLDRYAIQARVYSMAQEIAQAYGEQEFVLMPLLTGAIIFVADLVRHMPRRMRIEVMAVSSYPGNATSNQGTKVLYPSRFEAVGKHMLVIDDILDSGKTLEYVTALLRDAGAASVKTCVLLRKKIALEQHITADFTGFDIPDEFVVGYGLDYNDYYRNLPDIAVLQRRVFERGSGS
jgi:hypoxanthine phosphoribosyltransferase